MRSVDKWCAQREEDLFHSQHGHGRQLAVSLLGFDGSLCLQMAGVLLQMAGILLRMAGVLEVVDVVLRKVAHKAAAIPVMPNDGPSPIHATYFASYHPSVLLAIINLHHLTKTPCCTLGPNEIAQI